MTGAEHHQEAERLMKEQVFIDAPNSRTTRSFPETVAAAHVHATLALVDYLDDISDQLGILNRLVEHIANNQD